MDTTGIRSTNGLPKIAEELIEFYNSHNIDLTSIFEKSSHQTAKTSSDNNNNNNNDQPLQLFPYRFIRLNPRFDSTDTLRTLEKEIIENVTEDKFPSNQKPISVSWVGQEWGFYAIPSTFHLASSKSFLEGRIYGMDISSGAALSALFSDCTSPTTADNNDDEVRILDLCCCPGLKLCAIADFCGQTTLTSITKKSTVIGVDINENRMSTCKKIVQKYHINSATSGKSGIIEKDDDATECQRRINKTNIQLYCQDGTAFGTNLNDLNLVFDSRAALEEENSRQQGSNKRKRMNKSARSREKKRLKQLASENWIDKNIDATNNGTKENGTGDSIEDRHRSQQPQIKLFDYVLVDAECSTDGSLKHMRERLLKQMKKETTMGSLVFEKEDNEESNPTLTEKQKLDELVDLQKRLLASGFRLLKPGGTLVYSTCSLSHEQNEGVVGWLLEQKQATAALVPVEFPETTMKNNKLVVSGSVKGTLRFYPNLIGQNQDKDDEKDCSNLYGDGFFMAKIRKANGARDPL